MVNSKLNPATDSHLSYEYFHNRNVPLSHYDKIFQEDVKKTKKIDRSMKKTLKLFNTKFIKKIREQEKNEKKQFIGKLKNVKLSRNEMKELGFNNKASIIKFVRKYKIMDMFNLRKTPMYDFLDYVRYYKSRLPTYMYYCEVILYTEEEKKRAERIIVNGKVYYQILSKRITPKLFF